MLSLRVACRGTGVTDVEIVLPRAEGDEDGGQPDAEDCIVLMGYPFRKTRLGAPLAVLTAWIGLSVVPLPGGWLNTLSPRAHEIRALAHSLMGAEAVAPHWPWSLTSFLTVRSLFLWSAYLALFYAAVHLAGNRRRAEKLTRLFMLVGVGCGVYGIGQWLTGLREMLGADLWRAGLRAGGPFGNSNHYALFMEMLLLVSLGWMGARLAGTRPRGRRESGRRRARMAQEDRARQFLGGLGIVAMGLGLVFSLSRSGITSAVAGCVAFVLLAGPRADPAQSGTIEVELPGDRSARGRSPRARRSTRYLWALALSALGVAVWIGVEPVVARFELMSTDWASEGGRQQVWADSVGAVRDFWITGSGLGSFPYVYPMYRSFGGDLYYTAAHNDVLQILIELGAPGLGVLVWLVAAIWRSARRARDRLCESASLSYVHSGYCAAVIAAGLHAFTDFGLQMPANALLFAVAVGIVVGLER